MRFTGTSVILTAIALVACAGPPPKLPSNATIGARAFGAVASPPAGAPPKIVGMAFSSLDVVRGSVWSGDFTTSTNVASLEVRSNLFSINVPRTTFGRFRFAVDVYDLPPIFIRGYALRVIARNTAGVEAEEDVPFRIR
jgi:hypothetical protein